MKNRDEIQKAHDLLHFLGSPDGPGVFRGEDAKSVHTAHDVLAWVLGFPCGDAFADNLGAAHRVVSGMGYEVLDAGEAISHTEAKKRGLA